MRVASWETLLQSALPGPSQPCRSTVPRLIVWVPCMSSQAFDRSCLVRLMEHLAPHAALLSDAGCPSVTHAAGQALQERPKFAHGMSQARRNVLHGFSLADAFVHPTNHGAVASVEPGQPNAPLGLLWQQLSRRGTPAFPRGGIPRGSFPRAASRVNLEARDTGVSAPWEPGFRGETCLAS
jgi:hypothetical protein